MNRTQLIEINKAIDAEHREIITYATTLGGKLDKIKSTAEQEEIETGKNDLYKLNSGTGTNPYFRLSFELGETKLLLKDYEKCFRDIEKAIITGETNIDLNNPIIASACKHFINEEGMFQYDKLDENKTEQIISSVEYQISPSINKFGNCMKTLSFHALDDFVDAKEFEIDVQGIYKELEQNEDDYTLDDIAEIKNSTVQLANLFARRKNSMLSKNNPERITSIDPSIYEQNNNEDKHL